MVLASMGAAVSVSIDGTGQYGCLCHCMPERAYFERETFQFLIDTCMFVLPVLKGKAT